MRGHVWYWRGDASFPVPSILIICCEYEPSLCISNFNWHQSAGISLTKEQWESLKNNAPAIDDTIMEVESKYTFWSGNSSDLALQFHGGFLVFGKARIYISNKWWVLYGSMHIYTCSYDNIHVSFLWYGVSFLSTVYILSMHIALFFWAQLCTIHVISFKLLASLAYLKSFSLFSCYALEAWAVCSRD